MTEKSFEPDLKKKKNKQVVGQKGEDGGKASYKSR